MDNNELHSTVTYGLYFYENISDFFSFSPHIIYPPPHIFSSVGLLNHIKLKWSVYMSPPNWGYCVLTTSVSLVPATHIVGVHSAEQVSHTELSARSSSLDLFIKNLSKVSVFHTFLKIKNKLHAQFTCTIALTFKNLPAYLNWRVIIF